MALQGFDEALFAELFVVGVVGFGDAVGVEDQHITCAKLALSNRAIPILENTQHGGGGVEALHGVIAAKEQAREMAAIGVTQVANGVVVFGEEECGEGAVRRVVAEELVHGTQKALRLIQSDGALAAQIGLQIGHQESCGDSFSRDVTDHEAEAFLAEIKKVIIIAADFASLDAKAGVFKSFQGRLRLGEEPSLNLFGDFEFLGDAALGFQPPGKGTALRFDSLSHLVEAHQRKGIAVKIPKAGKDAAPNRSVLCAGSRWVRRLRGAHVHLIFEAFQARRELEANSALGPFAVLGNHILGDKGDRHGPANELDLFRAGVRCDEGEVRGAVGRGDGYETTVGLNAGVKDQLEAELIEVEAQALLQITDENRNRLETQVRVLAIQANRGAVRPLLRRIAHGRDYKPRAVKRALGAGMVPNWSQKAQRAAPLQSHILPSWCAARRGGRHDKYRGLVFGPAEGGEGVVEAREGEADNVEVAAFDAGDVAAGTALDGVGAGFVVGLAGGEVAGDFFGGERGEVHQSGLDKGEALRVGEADEGDTGEDGVRKAGKFFEHVARSEEHTSE